MIAVVAGATGLVGSALISALCERAQTRKVIALVRRPLSRSHEKLVEIQADLSRPDSYRAALVGATDVYCCLGTTIKVAGSKEAFAAVDFEYPRALAEAALAAGCPRFAIVTAVGASAESSFFYNRVKGEVEASIAAMPFSQGVRIFRPSMLLGARKEQRPAEAVGQAIFSATRGMFRGPLTRFRGITADELARAMISSAARRDAGVEIYEGKTLFALTGA